MPVTFLHGTNKAVDSKGQYYVTLTQTGLKDEGVAASRGDDRDAVWSAYWTELNKYLIDNSARVIEWRSAPQLITEEDGRFWVRSRLSVVGRYGG